ELNKEQFVYFMHVVNGRLAGHHLPPTLPPAIKDKIYHSLDLASNAVSGINYTRRTDSSTSLASSGGPKKPGLYGEKSRNVALADSYLSKLRNAGTFENKAGSRYASAQVNEEEIKKLRKQLAELDDELADVRRQQQELVKDHSLRRGGGDETLSDITTGREEDEVGAAIRELSLFLEYKQQKKKHVDQLLLGDSKDSAATGGEESETLSEVKKDVYDLRSWHTFLKAQIDALDAFVQKGQDELVKLQLEALEASKKSTS
ncbi:endocytosis defective- protein, partial [Spiromyces aspiralis]